MILVLNIVEVTGRRLYNCTFVRFQKHDTPENSMLFDYLPESTGCVSLDFRSEDEEEDEDDDQQVSGFGSVIVVDNLPEVPAEKHDKLVNVVTKIFSQIGDVCDGS